MTGKGGKPTGVYMSTDANLAYGVSGDANPAYGLSTDANLAYGLSSPSHGEGQIENDYIYEMPQPPPTAAAKDDLEIVYE